MTVVLEKYMAEDLDVVNAAKVSFHRRSSTMGEAEAGITDSMARNEHGSPFEHNAFKFRVRVSIGVAREWMRHRISSFNEESSRYVKMRNDFYVPEISAVRVQVGKAMAYSFEPSDLETAMEFIEDLTRHYAIDYAFYEKWIARGVAKELVRYKLPLGLLTEFIWTVNLRSLFNFLRLRNAAPALLEIRTEAAEVERLVTEVMPVTMNLWNKNGRPKV